MRTLDFPPLQAATSGTDIPASRWSVAVALPLFTCIEACLSPAPFSLQHMSALLPHLHQTVACAVPPLPALPAGSDRADGFEGPLIIRPRKGDAPPVPLQYDEERVLLVSDWWHTRE